MTPFEQEHGRPCRGLWRGRRCHSRMRVIRADDGPLVGARGLGGVDVAHWLGLDPALLVLGSAPMGTVTAHSRYAKAPGLLAGALRRGRAEAAQAGEGRARAAGRVHRLGHGGGRRQPPTKVVLAEPMSTGRRGCSPAPPFGALDQLRGRLGFPLPAPNLRSRTAWEPDGPGARMVDEQLAPRFSLCLLGPWQVLRDDSVVHVGAGCPSAAGGSRGPARRDRRCPLVEEAREPSFRRGGSTLPSYSPGSQCPRPERAVEGGVAERSGDEEIWRPTRGHRGLWICLPGVGRCPSTSRLRAARTAVRLREVLWLWTRLGVGTGLILPADPRSPSSAAVVEQRDAVEEELLRITVVDGGSSRGAPGDGATVRARPGA